MKRFNWQIILGVFLVVLSVVIYGIDYGLFQNQFWIYFISDIAFLPIQILLVTLIVNGLLRIREKRAMLNKMNMVIGSFFSEVGMTLLKLFPLFDEHYESLREKLIITTDWSDKDYNTVTKQLKTFEYSINSRKGNLVELRSYLIGKRNFLLMLLENPNLLEHETFTELLWAVFHLTEELAYRQNVSQLSTADYDHLSTDTNRAYVLLIAEWLQYMRHLKAQYPYLYSLAVRINPFNPNASVEFK